MIEERARVDADKHLSGEERERIQPFLKGTANATAYGSLARLEGRDLVEEIGVTIHGPDADPKVASASTTEDPGPFAFPRSHARLPSAPG